MRTLFLLHEQRHLYFLEPGYVELYLPMTESGLLGETLIHPYQREIRMAQKMVEDAAGPSASQRVGAAERIVERLLHQKLIEFRPELVVYALTWPNECIAVPTLAALKQRHGFKLASVIWDHDESNELLQQYDRDVIAVSDCSIVADSLTRTRAIQARTGLYAGFENTERVVFMPTVPAPSLFHPRADTLHEITISGSGEGQRLEIHARLQAMGFRVHRSGGMMPGDTLLPIEAYAADLAHSKIVVNTQTMGSRTQIKGRVAQCLASGTFLLEQDNAESRAYLQGIDVVFWRSFDELAQLLQHHAAHPEERQAMAQRAHTQWKARYSTERFVRTVLETAFATPTPDPASLTGTVPTVSVQPPLRAHPPVTAPTDRTPMRLYIHTGNHNSHHGIADTVFFLKNAVQDSGHTACISDKIMPGHVNLLMEHFTDAKHLSAMVDGHAAGARYILIGTEPIVGGTFNGGIEGTHWHYSNAPYWKTRFDAFRVAAGLADAIWVLAESMVPAYAALFPDLPVRFLPHGYVNDFATVRQRPESERDIDFYFSGTMTDHRKDILRQLARSHHVVLNDSSIPEYLRQDHLSRAKVCLSLPLSPRNDIPSVSRMHFHVQNRSFVLQQKYALPCPLDPFVMHTPDDDVVAWATAALQLGNRREIANSAHDQFKAALPMSRIMPPLLDEALERAGRRWMGRAA